MTGLDDARKKLPQLASLDDGQFVDAVHQLYYPNMDKAALSARLGYAPPEQAAPQAGVLRTAGDVGIKLAQGVVDLGSSAVGLGSLATGGLVGKGARALGYDPKGTNDFLGDYLSDSQKAADNKVANADGFVDSVVQSVKNPRSILGGIAESAPGMVAGMGITGAVARGIGMRAALATAEGASASAAELAAGKGAAQAAQAALATKAGATAAQDAVEAAGTKLMALGSATEGAQSAGQIADDAQAAGRTYGDYALPALAAGAGTAAIGFGAGKLMGDSATEIATGAHSTGVKGGRLARAAKEFLSEGALEEMPQSAQEQYFTNIAQGEQDRMKGVAGAAGSGLITGGVMGAGMGAMQHEHAPAAAAEVAQDAGAAVAAPIVLPNTGPLSQAANAGQAAAAARADAVATQNTAAGAAQVDPSAARPLAEIDDRLAALVAIGHGSLPGSTIDADGNKVAVPAVHGRRLTADEVAEFNTLKQERAARVAIPADQQDDYAALLAQEDAENNKKFLPAQQAAAASRAANDDAQLTAMQAEEDRKQRDADAAAEAQQMATTNAIVDHGRAARAAANRAALQADVLADNTIPADQKKAAFRAALKRDGYINSEPTREEREAIAAATAPLPSAPNELVDAVPERVEAAPPSGGTNTRAVDDAIAAGMRLKTPGGSVLHKPGSSKIFKLSTAQKTYYDKAIARAANAAAGQGEAVAVPENSAKTPLSVNSDAQTAEIDPETAPNATPAPALIAPETPLDVAAHGAATSPLNDLAQPTAAQKEAGNYQVGHVRMHGLDLSIENPAGSTRSGTDRDGTPWETTMSNHYGYIKGTVGADKDHVDVFVGPHHDSGKVFVVDQVHPDSGKFDEHKVMLGFDNVDTARAAYQANYAAGWQGGKTVSETDIGAFKQWLASDATRRPFAKTAPAPKRVAPATPTLTKQELNKMTVKDMSDSELIAAQTVLADTPRAPKIDKEIAARGLDAHSAPTLRQADAAPELPASAHPLIAALHEQGVAPAHQIAQAKAELDGGDDTLAKDLLRIHAPVDDEDKAASDEPRATAPADGKLVNATAPEHIQLGVDDRELGQIVDEFNAAQAEMMDGEHAVSNVFQPPKKKDVVRLQDKSKATLWDPKEVKLYNQNLEQRDTLLGEDKPVPAELAKAIADFEAVYLPHVARLLTAAKAEIGTWKAHAQAQGENNAMRMANGRKIVLSLFDLSGEWSKPWEEAGYQVYRFDIQDEAVVGDVNNFSSQFFGDWFGDFEGLDIHAILAATPCTDFAVSGARHFAAKDADGRTVSSVKLVHQTLRTIEYFKPAVWALENPVGRIEKLGGLPPWRMSFDPNHLGDPYTKKTLLWGRFNADLPVAPVEPTEGSKMHKLYGGKSMATKNARSVTPEGFSYGFFMANNAIDHPAMAIANKYDRLDRKGIEQALAAGVTEQQINEAVEDPYYMDLDDDAANAALKVLTDEHLADKAAAAEPDHDDGADIPLAFYKRQKVPLEVWLEDEGHYETVDMPADKALSSVREDIENLVGLLACMKG